MDEQAEEKEIKGDEGCRLDVYLDTRGNPTVGIGHLVTPEDNLQVGDVITQEQCDAFFRQDLHTAIEGCVKAPGIPFLHQPEAVQEALVDMAFNTGLHGLAGFTGFLGLIKQGDYNAAADDLLSTKVAEELPERYARIADQIRSAA